MVDPVRVLAVGGTIGMLVGGTILAPQMIGAAAEEPVKAVASAIGSLFPDTVDPKMFRHYDITFDDSISTEVSRTQVIEKIAHGRTSQVTIVTTPSGTYSTDGIVSPHVLYPGIDKTWRSWPADLDFGQDGSWASYSEGSFTYFVFRVPSART
jgi:hypothetical protein